MTDTIRLMRDSDAGALAMLVHRAIREGASAAYTEDQCTAWSPAPRSAEAFLERVAGQTVLVAEDKMGHSGVFTLTEDGLFDLGFVRPDRIGSGVARKLYEALLKEARARSLPHLTVEASHMLRPFLERRGWALVETQTVTPNGVAMENHRMELEL